MKHHSYSKAFMWAALLAAGLTALVGCSKSYPGVKYDEHYGEMIGSQETFDSIPILLTFSTPQLNFVSRALGPVDDALSSAEWLSEHAKFYCFAYQAENHAWQGQTDFSQTSIDDPHHCLVDGYYKQDEYGAAEKPEHGKELKLYLGYSGSEAGLDGSFDWAQINGRDAMAYYSLEHQEYKYNFYTYYYDDAKQVGPVHRDKDSIWFDLEFDGRHDLITGVARPAYSESEKSHLEGEYNKELLADFVSRKANYVYSSKLGHRGIHPNFRVQHSMVRFTFNVNKAAEAAENVTVKDISIVAPYKGRFVVAHKDTTKLGLRPALYTEANIDTFHLPERVFLEDSDIPEAYAYRTNPRDNHTGLTYGKYNTKEYGMKEPFPVGADLLLPPMTVYPLTIICERPIKKMLPNGTITEVITEYKGRYDLALNERKDKLFEPGKSYAVNISIYGLESIALGVSGFKWGYGGDVNVGEEDLLPPQ